MIPLVRDTIEREDLSKLSDWLLTNPRLTKGQLTTEFENKWSKWLGTSYSVFTNSGSSANFLMIDALIQSGRLSKPAIIAPAVSWVTTVAPIMQLGLRPVLCDADEQNLGLNLDHLEHLLKANDVGAVMIVHVLGVPNHMKEIQFLCDKYEVPLIEDCCESHGSLYEGQKVGTFGLMSSFSFYYGHHMSTIEGGMISCNDEELYSVILSIRSHGWARDLPSKRKEALEREYNIGSFESLYTFYYAGFNFRSSDLNAFLGLQQLRKLDSVVAKRNANYWQYTRELPADFWIQSNEKSFVSSFAFGLIHERRPQIVKALTDNGIECRPLICGSIGQQPFWKKSFGTCSLPNADRVHKYGFYVPNNHEISSAEITMVCDVIKRALTE
jgi:CDP-6-deoxy-D-xylo-4-hexulose-3-dehydrase